MSVYISVNIIVTVEHSLEHSLFCLFQVIDLMFFLGIFLFFLLSFGIMYQANLFPNSPPSWYLLKSVVYIPYWQMYGELFLENLEGIQILSLYNSKFFSNRIV